MKPLTFGRPNGKVAPVSTNPSIAQAPIVTDTAGSGETRLKASTYITNAGQSQILYNGDRVWARLTLVLETAGPVAVGDFSNLQPVLSGNGILLTTGVPITLDVAKGNKIYVAATGVNRIKVLVQPYPWLEQITALIGSVKAALSPLATLLGR